MNNSMIQMMMLMNHNKQKNVDGEDSSSQSTSMEDLLPFLMGGATPKTNPFFAGQDPMSMLLLKLMNNNTNTPQQLPSYMDTEQLDLGIARYMKTQEIAKEEQFLSPTMVQLLTGEVLRHCRFIEQQFKEQEVLNNDIEQLPYMEKNREVAMNINIELIQNNPNYTVDYTIRFTILHKPHIIDNNYFNIIRDQLYNKKTRIKKYKAYRKEHIDRRHGLRNTSPPISFYEFSDIEQQLYNSKQTVRFALDKIYDHLLKYQGTLGNIHITSEVLSNMAKDITKLERVDDYTIDLVFHCGYQRQLETDVYDLDDYDKEIQKKQQSVIKPKSIEQFSKKIEEEYTEL